MKTRRHGNRYLIPLVIALLLGCHVPVLAQTGIVSWNQDTNVTAGGGTHVHNTDISYSKSTGLMDVGGMHTHLNMNSLNHDYEK